MKRFNARITPLLQLTVLAGAFVLGFQNCGQKMTFSQAPAELGSLGACDGVSCSLAPLTSKPAVTTILLALGDKADNQLVVNGASSQLVAETVVRYSTPATNPKILVVHDSNSGAESPDDFSYVADTLLSRYEVTEINEPAGGLSASDLAGFDLIWFNNPGNPMGNAKSRDALIAFTGGVILQGDDLSQGSGFDISALTGLKNIDNGTSIVCDGGKTYNTDDNLGVPFVVSLDSSKFTGSATGTLQFDYGNDIDDSTPIRSDLEILATAIGSPSDCAGMAPRPAIVRYFKPAAVAAVGQ